jgi:Na+/proline symporter
MSVFMSLLLVYILLLIGIGYYTGRNETDVDYLIAGRNRPWWQVTFSKFAAAIGAGWIIVYNGLSYEFGISLGFVFLGLVIGSVMYAHWAVPRLYAITSAHNCYTLGDYIQACTKSVFASKVGNVVSILMSLVVLTVAVVGGATLMEKLGVLSYDISIVRTVGVVLIYLSCLRLLHFLLPFRCSILLEEAQT